MFGNGVQPMLPGSGDRRSIATLIALLFFMGIVGYGLGWGAMRYSNTIDEPWVSWRYWRHAIAMGDPVLLICCLLIFFVDLGTGRGTGFITAVIFYIIILCMGYMAFFIVWEIVVWSRCNNLTGPTPDYPECINRFYPSHTYPDVSFLLMFFGTVTSLLAAAIAFWFHSRLQCAATSDYILSQPSYNATQQYVPMTQPPSQQMAGIQQPGGYVVLNGAAIGGMYGQYPADGYTKHRRHHQHSEYAHEGDEIGAPFAADGSAFMDL